MVKRRLLQKYMKQRKPKFLSGIMRKKLITQQCLKLIRLKEGIKFNQRLGSHLCEYLLSGMPSTMHTTSALTQPLSV